MGRTSSSAEQLALTRVATRWQVILQVLLGRRRYFTASLACVVSTLGLVFWILRRWLRMRAGTYRCGTGQSRGKAAIPAADVPDFYSTVPPEVHKTRPCRWWCTRGKCNFAEHCIWAHQKDELRQLPQSQRLPDVPHWRGQGVTISVVEHALFSDPPPEGTIDILCNRCTCFGNPFAGIMVGPDEEKEPLDKYGYRASDHEALCEAFDEFLNAVLDGRSGENLIETACSIASSRSMVLAKTWVCQQITRTSFLESLERFSERIVAGTKLRLLCHCRPHVRCHTEYLKSQLELRAQQLGWLPPAEMQASNSYERWEEAWPSYCDWSSDTGNPPCASKGCDRQGRALDPKDSQWYCTFCWMQFADYLLTEVKDKKFKEVSGGVF